MLKQKTIFILGVFILGSFLFLPREIWAISTQVINLPTSKLGLAEENLSYTMGVGDFNGDGNYDYLVRVWEDNGLSKTFETITYAYLNDGAFLWQLNHHLSYGDVGGDPTWTVPLSAWDMDGDGKDEVITQKKEGGQVKLVILDGMTGLEEKSRSIPLPKKVNHQTIAYLDGNNPFIVHTYGHSIKTVAYDRNLNEYWRFDDPSYADKHSWTNIYTFDFDNDGKDEIINGPILIDHDGSLYLDGTKFISPGEGDAARSFVADIDPTNLGYEWYLIRGGTHSDPYYVQPNYWEGPYLIDLDQKKMLWHHNLDIKNEGWGREHRGWVYDIDSSVSGLEMWATGYFWEGSEWPDALDGKFGTSPQPGDVWVDGYSEKHFLYDAKGNILKKVVGYHVGYPLYWDDDEEAEYFRYRGGQLLDKFRGSTLESGLARAYGSGESIQADIKGDWREEIIVASGYKLYIYSNSDSTSFPNRPSPRDSRNYLLNLASYGTGLPKPLPPFEIGVSAPPPPAKKGDLNSDGQVDVIDLGILLSNWNLTSRPAADINQDGRVDIIDLGILLSNWG